ncbi:F-box/kelch-repeat protein [Raphanus sativus]|nr:F-box/kelch-repeat protein [Raphanus sativus]
MGQAKINRSNKPKPEADRSAKDATERHQRSRLCAWNPFSRKLKPTCFIPIWRKWRKSDKRSTSRELPPEIIREILIRLPLVGISNGLVCISPHEDEDVVSLYNPTTKESKLLLPQSVPSRYRENFQSYGFGFDHLTDDYKVVKLVSDRHNFLYACVYSLKSNSWRWICDLSYQRINRSRRPGVNLNGVIHWVVFTRGNHKQRLILAFDIITEEFREMPFPDEEAEDCPNSFKDFVVGNLNERLCVVNSCRELLHDDIWVMNEFGVASSWTRIRISLLHRLMKPVCTSTKNSAEVLLVLLGGDMVLYNFERFHVENTYVESLISPNSYGFDN